MLEVKEFGTSYEIVKALNNLSHSDDDQTTQSKLLLDFHSFQQKPYETETQFLLIVLMVLLAIWK